MAGPPERCLQRRDFEEVFGHSDFRARRLVSKDTQSCFAAGILLTKYDYVIIVVSVMATTHTT